MQSAKQTTHRLLTAQPQVARVLPVLAGIAAMCLASQVRFHIPGTEVPMTLQSLAALLCGFFLSPVAAVSAIVGYLALGAAGLPLFCGSAGLLGSTGGYLIGFAVCAGLISVLRGGASASSLRLFAAGLVGTAALFVCGLVGQTVFKGSFEAAFLQGAVPFFGKAVIQLAFAVALVKVATNRKSVSEEDS